MQSRLKTPGENTPQPKEKKTNMSVEKLDREKYTARLAKLKSETLIAETE